MYPPDIDHIVKKFKLPEEKYTVLDLEEQQGWGTKVLLRLDFGDKGKYVLKGKDDNQIGGLLESSKLTEYFVLNKYLVRQPILTKENKFLYTENYITWNVTKYIEGIDSNFSNYQKSTIESLIEHINGYMELTYGNENLAAKYNIEIVNKNNVFDSFKRVADEKVSSVLLTLINSETVQLKDWLTNTRQNILNIYQKNDNKAIIHGDLHNKNILTSTDSTSVAAIIDWDHCKFDLALLDIATFTNQFYEHVVKVEKQHLLQYFMKNLENIEFFSKILNDYELIRQFQLTKTKWNSILFYADLLIKYGDTTHEEDRFIATIKSEAHAWKALLHQQ
ncbi:MAG: phosphotransferase [Patescibacteria group bacterium]